MSFLVLPLFQIHNYVMCHAALCSRTCCIQNPNVVMKKIYPRTGDTQTVYLNTVVKDPSIEVGDYTIYNDFVSDPLLFERNNVLSMCFTIILSTTSG